MGGGEDGGRDAAAEAEAGDVRAGVRDPVPPARHRGVRRRVAREGALLVLHGRQGVRQLRLLIEPRRSGLRAKRRRSGRALSGLLFILFTWTQSRRRSRYTHTRAQL